MPNTWHITFGTYGDRLHGDSRPTVDRRHNKFGTPFVGADPARLEHERAQLKHTPVRLKPEQIVFIESIVPTICQRGGWRAVAVAAGSNHVHVLLSAPSQPHGKEIRRWLTRWLTEALNERWSERDGAPWWAEGGSTKLVHDREYLEAATAYVLRQRATRVE